MNDTVWQSQIHGNGDTKTIEKNKAGVVINPSGYDDTITIQKMMNELSGDGGGEVKLGRGQINFSQIIVPKNIYLVGSGRNVTTLKVIAGTTKIPIVFSDNSYYSTIDNMTIDGNDWSSKNGVATDYGALIYCYRDNVDPKYFDAHIHFKNLVIRNSAGKGLHLDSNIREAVCDNLNIFNSRQQGLVTGANSSDNKFTNLTVWCNKQDNILVGGTFQSFTSCKSWYGGIRTTQQNGLPISDTTHNVVTGWLVSASRCTFVNCSAQDNSGNGVKFVNANNISWWGGQIESNNWNDIAKAPRAEKYAAFHLAGTCDHINIKSQVADNHNGGCYAIYCEDTTSYILWDLISIDYLIPIRNNVNSNKGEVNGTLFVA